MTDMLGPVTIGTRDRLTQHYGHAVSSWLAAVPGRITAAAAAWNLTISGYHDAGCASVIVLASDAAGTPQLIKAWYDKQRYLREVRALRTWGPWHSPAVTHTRDHLAVASMTMVAGLPGGSPAPADHYNAVAHGLLQLHDARAAPPSTFPSLAGYIERQLLPRIHRRAEAFGGRVPRSALALGMSSLGKLSPLPARRVLLHGDLYRENVLFDANGRPVFIDPLPMTGDPAFDWAFWTVYYDLGRGTSERLVAAQRVSGIRAERLLPWCLTLCLDGLLYYAETNDPRLLCMIGAITTLGATTDDGPN